eukprot:m.200040 g.200040  ORF g.200040 m.200040 type:complete len:323 (-) comp20939_c0_seq1:141-1109(-)
MCCCRVPTVYVYANGMSTILSMATVACIMTWVDTAAAAAAPAAGPACPPALTFSTGFGPGGNDPSLPNRMGRHGVTQAEASALMQAGAGSRVVDCPFGDPILVGPRGAQRYLCGLNQLDPSMPLFSFGSNGDFRFEDAVRQHAPRIPVVVFDPTMSVQAMASRNRNDLARAFKHTESKGYAFVPLGIGYRRGWLKMDTIKGKRLFCAQVDTLPQLLHHHSTYDKIGVLKIDASGELELFARLEAHGFNLTSAVGILLLEVHLYHPQEDGSTANCCYGPRDVQALFTYLEKSGFRLVGRELGPEACCGEFSFVNPSFPGFHRH